VDWTPSYLIIGTLVAGAVLIALVLAAAKMRVRPLWFVTLGVVFVVGAVVYAEYHDAQLASDDQSLSPTGLRSRQIAGESTVGRKDTGGGQSEEARAPNITKTETPLRIADDQRGKVRDYLAKHPGTKVEQVDFSLVIGGAVPRQAQLTDLPAGLADLLNGYTGDQYLLVRDQMVIVDSQSRRIVALIPGVG
jgi:hypothetical protein